MREPDIPALRELYRTLEFNSLLRELGAEAQAPVATDYQSLDSTADLDAFVGDADPVAVAGGLPFSQVDAGNRHTCGVTTGGVGYCWGYGGDGELGDGTDQNQNRLRPTRVVAPI